MTVRRLIASRRRLARVLLGASAIAAALVLLAHPLAAASDVLSNVAPASQLPSGSLANAYPLGNYTLDHHFEAVSASLSGGVDASGVAPTIEWMLADTVWQLTAFLGSAVITLFTFAFSLDLIGSGSRGDGGALAPVAAAVRSIYRDTFGEPWLVVAILLTGLWAMWNGLVRRRFTETAGALGISIVFVVVALAFVTRPEIIGQASRLTNQISGAFLALSSSGNLASQEQAKRANADRLHARLIYEPWVVLNFGGLAHCVARSGDQQRSVPVRPLSQDPGRDALLARRLAAGTQVQADGKLCISNANKYAARFLRYSPEDIRRELEYRALAAGDTSKLALSGIRRLDIDPSDGYRLSEADKPAADAMQKGGQDQRLLLAVVVFLGELGMFLLLGGASVVVVTAQVLVLLLLAFAPVALVIGTLPGRGHEFFKGWLSRLGTYLLRKAVYSLVLAVLLTVNAALAAATSDLGWLLAFGLSAVFNWTVFLNRRQLVGQLSHALTGNGRVESDGLGRAVIAGYAIARLAGRHPRAWGTDAHGQHHRRTAGRASSQSTDDADDAPAGPHRSRGPEHGDPPAPRPTPAGGPVGRGGGEAAATATDEEEKTDRPTVRAISANASRPDRVDTPAAATHEHDVGEDAVAKRPATRPADGGGRSEGDAHHGRSAASDVRARRSHAESALRRGLREDARRIRHETRRLHEQGRWSRDAAHRASYSARPTAAKPPRAERHESPIEPVGLPQVPLDPSAEEQV